MTVIPKFAPPQVALAQSLPAARRSRLYTFSLALLVVVCLAVAAPSARAQTPFYFGAHILGHRLPEQNQSRLGYGFRAGYEAYLPFISLETEVNFFPTSSTGDLGETQALFGLKFGKKIGRWGAFVKARPGFTHFGGGLTPNKISQHTNFALDLGGGMEYAIFPKADLRFDIGNTRIYYGNATLLNPFALAARLNTRNTLQTGFGLVIHF